MQWGALYEVLGAKCEDLVEQTTKKLTFQIDVLNIYFENANPKKNMWGLADCLFIRT